MTVNPEYPKKILLISGKRKCGKDYIAEKLKTKLNNDCTILRISEPIKKYYAETVGISLNELLSDGPLKEKHRLEMIIWGEKKRLEDSGCFCRKACEDAVKTPIWIVSDVRRHTDIEYFKNIYGEKIKTIRIKASDGVRKSRGWIFTQGVDNAESECNLDDFKDWDLEILNEENNEDNISKIIELLKC